VREDYVVIRHAAEETLGLLAPALELAGRSFAYTDTFAAQTVPQDIGSARGLIVLGGPMGVYEADRYPYLADEMRLIAHTVRAERPVLGICLGAQLLAGALGARVYPGSIGPEFGWHDIRRSPLCGDDRLFHDAPATLSVVHWHGDTFDLPEGARLLWSSEKYPHQAFAAGKGAYGLQFHLELTPGMIADWTSSTPAETLVRGGTDAATLAAETPARAATLTPIAGRVFARFLAL
jgi:GMP synthase (glutamine-hydrolysing)